ncbi:MAG: multiheme c-type cytochrome [Candidatus Thiodiazotropha sp. (ex. Lucinoma kazani)]
MGKTIAYRVMFFGWLPGILCLTTHTAFAEQQVPQGPFTDTECITCHTERDPVLIKQWREGPHSTASEVECSSCHGDRHKDSGIRARKDESCSGCHEGPVSHSYTTSKHGVINRLEEGGQDWRQPLQRGHYRAPGCSYCHLHNGDTMAPDRGPEVRQWICSGCHSPRYVREQFANGKRQLAIADLKLAEGESLMSSVTEGQPGALPRLRQNLIRHRENVLLGVGHQSPDYQWWHGQPALDGDLIRIRDAISEFQRRKRLSDNPEE